MEVRVWRFVDYDLVDFIWDCPHCLKRVGIRDEYDRDKGIACPICTTKMNVNTMTSVNAIDSDPKYHDPYVADVTFSNMMTKAELLLEVDTVIEAFEVRIRDAVAGVRAAALALPDMTLDVDTLDASLAELWKHEYRFGEARKALNREKEALKRYREAPIP